MRKRILVALLLLAVSSFACAREGAPGDTCPALRSQLASPLAATRVAAAACNEHLLWFRPFIDVDGRLVSATVWEAEASRLADGASEPWRRVAGYWRDSGLLWQMSNFPGARECARAGSGGHPPSCRAFVIDRPWSAAFISYVLTRAGLPGFRPSAGHYDYVAAAYADPAQSPFQLLDPATAKPGRGDLLCYMRNNGQVFGHAGFVDALAGGGGPYNMHCDIVVAAEGGKAYLVGGNVQQGVTMRMLALNRNGKFWSLPRRTGAEGGCSPDNPSACSFNRQDWVALLKLKPEAALARLPRATPVVPTSVPGPDTGSSQCCTACVVGSGVPRCPNRPADPLDSQR